MANTILEGVKIPLGIDLNNLGFDNELLLHINSAKSTLVHLGVTALDVVIDKDTAWPSTGSVSLDAICLQYLALRVKKDFDPSANPGIATAMDQSLTTLEGRIAFEVEEIEDAGP